VLALELTDPGFDHTVLSAFRSRLRTGGAEHLLRDVLLERFRAAGLLKAHHRQRTDAPHVLAVVRALNRLQLVRETRRATLDVFARIAPTWLQAAARIDWVKRSGQRRDEYRLPTATTALRALAETIGRDGMDLVDAVYASDAPTWLREVPAVEILRRIWVQNYVQTEAGVRFRTAADGIPAAAQFLSSPHDVDAHLCKQGSTSWVGYKVVLTETCEDDAPNLITHVATISAPTADGTVTPEMHRDLHARDLLPRVQLVDTGFLDAELLVTSQQAYGVERLGPTRRDQRWQSRAAAGCGVEDFVVDFERRIARCPEGTRASSGSRGWITGAPTASISGSRQRTARPAQPGDVHQVAGAASTAQHRHSPAGAI
jgi:transposase